MKVAVKHHITVGNKKYDYQLSPVTKKTTKIICPAANIDQEFLNEDIPELLADLPDLIISEKEYQQNQSITIRFRVSPDDKKTIEKNATKKGYSSVSAYLRDISLKGA